MSMLCAIDSPKIWDRMGNQLRNVREARKLSLRKLSEMTGMDHSLIARIERGDVRLASHHIEIFAPALGVKPEELVSDEAVVSPLERDFLNAIEGLSEENVSRVIDLAKALKH